MYPSDLVAPMKQDLVLAGFTELHTPEEVDAVLNEQKGTTLVVVNSVCGCAAGAGGPRGRSRAIPAGAAAGRLNGWGLTTHRMVRPFFCSVRPEPFDTLRTGPLEGLAHPTTSSG